MIWLVRCAVLISIVGMALLALRTSSPPAATVEATAPTPPTATAEAVEPTPRLSVTLPPRNDPVVSRNLRETPAPRPTLSTTVLDVAAVEFSYQPARLTVRPGATVTFRNRGSEGHDV